VFVTFINELIYSPGPGSGRYAVKKRLFFDKFRFFSMILYYNLTKSPTNFIFGEYAVGGVPNLVSVFEKNRTGSFKVIRT